MIGALVLAGAMSVYAPGDGFNAGELACGGRFTHTQEHIAIRGWRGRCGSRALVCTRHRCVFTTVRDSGPWGLVCPGKPWRVHTGCTPAGCRRRAVVDLSWGLWKRLGRPRFLSRVLVIVYGRQTALAGGEV